jgi:Fe-S-cluster-containing dehydrogenase component
LKKLRVSISFNEKKDETSELCKFLIPSNHFLESWGDAEPKTGYFSMMQPTIAPLFKTRQYQDSLLKWTGNTNNYETYFRNFWTGRLGSADALNKALQDGVIEPAAPAAATASFNGAGTAGAVTALASARKATNKPEVVLYQSVAAGDGKQANNPWLLELPDPITRATWDNYAMISVKLGKELLGVDLSNVREADSYTVHPEKQVLNIKVGNKEVELPALIVPGMNDDTIAIAVGYGRKSASGKDEDTARNIGRAVIGVGQNAFTLAALNGNTIDWNLGEATVTKTPRKYKIAQAQVHNSYEGRHEVVKELTLAEFTKNPATVREQRAAELKPWGGLEKFESDGTLYPTYDRPGIRWGMSIDLNACYGCGACVVACNAENNIPVVGKTEVARYHDMHWLRIDRYFSGDPADPESIQTVFQPMLCQHCDNAPCENVCPVAATNHNSEGINQMIYNRCIGTRYCANNCPYKVRRFNWADYTGADSFKDNQKGVLDDSVMMMNDDLTRMVLNPDVTVRSRGVIEKCSFCVQRLQEGKLKAKKENRTLTDSDAQTACAQACPADAIVFGNANSLESIISKTRSENKNRMYYVLEQIHTLPNVNYLAKVRNTDVLTAHHPTETDNMEPGKKVETHSSH